MGKQTVGNIFGSRDAFRLACKRDLIEEGEVWMDMIMSRALTSHTYNEGNPTPPPGDLFLVYQAEDGKLKLDVRFDDFEELTQRIQDIRTSERRFSQKITDNIYATSIDFDPTQDVSIRFFKTVQKQHGAITCQTAAENRPRAGGRGEARHGPDELALRGAPQAGWCYCQQLPPRAGNRSRSDASKVTGNGARPKRRTTCWSIGIRNSPWWRRRLETAR